MRNQEFFHSSLLIPHSCLYMKKRFLGLLAMLILLALPLAAKAPAGSKVGVEFAETVFDFGTVNDGKEPVVHTFTFTNTGSGPVAIERVSVSCGCTKPEYSRKPVSPGEKGEVKIKYNPAGQKGEVTKDIKVRMRNGADRTEVITLRLRGVVIPNK